MSPALTRNSVRTVLAIALYAALAVVIGRYLAGTNWAALADLEPSWLPLLAAFPISLAVRFLQPRAWARLIEDFGGTTPPWRLLNLVHAQSWLARYLPGKIGWVGGRMLFGQELGVAPGGLAITALVEAVIQMGTAIAVAALLAAASRSAITDALLLPAAAVTVATILALAPPVLRRWIEFAQRRLMRSSGGAFTQLSSRAILTVAAMYAVIHLVGGVPTFLLIRAVHPELPASTFPYVVASSLLAGAVGSLAIVAPSGLGVREGMLVLTLGSIMPREIAALAAVALRLWSIALDLAFVAMSWALKRGAFAQRSR